MKVPSRFELYEAAVQVPAHEVSFFERAFRDAHQARPLTLREDFCASAAISREWVASAPDRRAWAVDHDPEPLALAVGERLTAVCADVRLADTPPVDVVSVGNFSINELGEREALVAYLRTVHEHALGAAGVLVLDVMGGPARQVDASCDRRRCRGFDVEWRQTRFDPISGRGRFTLSFILDGGRRLDDAFVYDWRLWALPELRDALAEAGFADSVVYWAGPDTKQGGHQGTYKRRREAPAEPSFVAYLVGVKQA